MSVDLVVSVDVDVLLGERPARGKAVGWVRGVDFWESVVDVVIVGSVWLGV